MASCVCYDINDVDDDNIIIKGRMVENQKRSINVRAKQIGKIILKTRKEIILINIQICRHLILGRVKGEPEIEKGKLFDLRVRKQDLMFKLNKKQEILKFLKGRKY